MVKSLWLILQHLNLITTKLYIVPWSTIQFRWNPKTYANLILWFYLFLLWYFFKDKLFSSWKPSYEVWKYHFHNLPFFMMTKHIDEKFLHVIWLSPLSCISPPFLWNYTMVYLVSFFIFLTLSKIKIVKFKGV